MATAPSPRAGLAHQSSTRTSESWGAPARRTQAALVAQCLCPDPGQRAQREQPAGCRGDARSQRSLRSSVPSGLVRQRWGSASAGRRTSRARRAQCCSGAFSIICLPPGSAHSLELRPTASLRDEGCVMEKFRCVELRKSEFVFIGNWSNSCLTNVLHPLRVLRSHLADAPDTEIRITSISAIMQNIRWRCACYPTFFLPDG